MREWLWLSPSLLLPLLVLFMKRLRVFPYIVAADAAAARATAVAVAWEVRGTRMQMETHGDIQTP